MIAPLQQSIASSGGSFQFAVTTEAGCGWTVSTPDSWITITSAANWSGSATVTYTVASNTGASRAGVITLAGEQLTITQSASPLNAPANLVATRQSTTSALITWNASSGAAAYELFRGTSTGNFMAISTNAISPFTDLSLAPGTTYLYKVRAVNGGGASAFSNLDLSTTVLFTDDPVVPEGTTVLAAHMTELREAVNAVRVAAGLGPGAYTNDPLIAGATVVDASHIAELRTQLTSALVTLGLPAPSFTDPTLVPESTPLKAAHVQDLRNATK